MRYILLVIALLVTSTGLALAQNTPNTSPSAGAFALKGPAGAAIPASLTALGTWTSQCMPSQTYRSLSVFGELAGAGTLQMQRYADAACTLPVGLGLPNNGTAATPLALTQGGGCPGSSYCGSIGVYDYRAFLGFTVTLTDTSNATNAIAAGTPQLDQSAP